jgi:hypothetical protein
MKRWYEENPEKRKEYRRKHGPIERASRLLRFYGMTPEEYAAMHAAQGGLCLICQREETRTIKGTRATLCVDHDHETGRVRGLLCATCNKTLGLWLDNEVWFDRAARYLVGAL